ESLSHAPSDKHVYIGVDVTDDSVDSLPENIHIDTEDLKKLNIEDLATLLKLDIYINNDGVTAKDYYDRNALLVAFASQNYSSVEDWHMPASDECWYRTSLQLVEDPFNRHIMALFEVQNITELKARELMLLKQAKYDNITGLYNFSATEDLIRHKLQENIPSAFLFTIEIDNYSAISADIGLAGTSVLLHDFADILKSIYKEPAVAGCVSKSQFLVYSSEITSIPMFEESWKKLQQAAAAITVDGNALNITCSVGAALVYESCFDFSVLFNRADLSLYHARIQGGNTFCVYSLSQWSSSSDIEAQRTALMMLSNKSSKKHKYDTNNFVSFDSMLQWLVQNHLILISESTMLKGAYDFLLLVDPVSHEIEYIERGKPSKFKNEMNSWKGKKCYEVLLNEKGGKNDNYCKNCKKCENGQFSIHQLYLEILKKDYVVYEKNIEYQGKTKHLIVFTHVENIDESTKILQQSFINQSFLFDCIQPAFDLENDVRLYVESVLKKLCAFFNCECGFVCTFAHTIGTVQYNIPKSQYLPTALDISQSTIDKWYDMASANSMGFVFSTVDIKQENKVIYNYFVQRDIESVCLIPIWCENRINGFLELRNGKVNLSGMPFVLNSISVSLGTYINRIIRQEENELQFFHDSLTGYLNFSGFQREVRRILSRNKTDNFSMWYCDIKRFKYINDSYGFDAGNSFLRYWADHIASKLQEDETFCRVSGNNFCLLLHYQNINELVDKFYKMEHSLSQFFEHFYDRAYEIELVAGIYLFKAGSEDASIDEMLNRASMAQRNVKPLHGSNLGFYTEKMREQALRDIMLEREMEEALENEEFEIYLQPKVCINKDAYGAERFHAEALVRWVRNGKIFASPAEFIPLFEKSDKIIKLDRYVFEKSFQMVRRFKEAGLPVSIAVNASRISLLHSDFVTTYADLLDKYQIEEGEVEIEFTESVAVNELEPLIDLLHRLKAYGCICEMDDFGAGYSSLNVLQRLPLNGLKIDQRFFLEFDSLEKQAAVIASIVDMARRLDMMTIAEGIETEDQVEMLKNLKCDYIQGYIFAKPMKENDFVDYISSKTSTVA
ncbi:MAG: EAL domain-containing protein, partial [Spirochaetaceae bacterium]|nr:EAL domain-containing protein [Spirochaetaceae bacterium]